MPVVQVWNSLSFPSKDVFVPFIPFLFKSPLLFSPVHLPTFIPILSLSLSLSILSPLFSNNFSLYLKHLVSATPSFHPFVLFFSHTTCVCVCVCVCVRARVFFRSALYKHSRATYSCPVSVFETISNLLAALQIVVSEARLRGLASKWRQFAAGDKGDKGDTVVASLLAAT